MKFHLAPVGSGGQAAKARRYDTQKMQKIIAPASVCDMLGVPKDYYG